MRTLKAFFLNYRISDKLCRKSVQRENLTLVS